MKYLVVHLNLCFIIPGVEISIHIKKLKIASKDNGNLKKSALRINFSNVEKKILHTHLRQYTVCFTVSNLIILCSSKIIKIIPEIS